MSTSSYQGRQRAGQPGSARFSGQGFGLRMCGLDFLLNELNIFRALGLSTLAFQLIGENIDFQSEIELVLSLLSKEYKNEIPKFLKVAAGRPEVLLGKTGQDRLENLFIKIIVK